MKRIFAFALICVLLMPYAFAADSEESPSISDMMEGVFDLVGQVVPSVDGDVVEFSPETDVPDSPSSNVGGGGSNLLVVNTSPTYTASDLAEAVYRAIVEAEAERVDEYATISDIEIMPLYTPDTGQTSIPTGSLRYVLTQVIGPYSPVVVQYQYTNGSNTAYLREIMPDYVWMISAAMFALVLYCVFRLWGVVLCRR